MLRNDMWVWPGQCEDKAWNQLPNLTPSNTKIWTPGFSNSPTPSLNLKGFPRYTFELIFGLDFLHLWSLAQLNRFYLGRDKTCVSDGWAEHGGDRRSPRAADWTSLLDLPMHLANTKGFIIEAQNDKKTTTEVTFWLMLNCSSVDFLTSLLYSWRLAKCANVIWMVLLLIP